MKSISSKKLNGNILIPGDKSISHRLIILSSIAIGKSNIKGILKSDDIIKTITRIRITRLPWRPERCGCGWPRLAVAVTGCCGCCGCCGGCVGSGQVSTGRPCHAALA